jgi:hypothetical protein
VQEDQVALGDRPGRWEGPHTITPQDSAHLRAEIADFAEAMVEDGLSGSVTFSLAR